MKKLPCSLTSIRGQEKGFDCIFFEGISRATLRIAFLFWFTECLTGHLVSREAEVYSYGIFLLELITRKKPLASSLAVDKSLYVWVQKRFPLKGIGVADPHLLSTTYNHENLLSFIYLALSCVEQSQENRPNMNDIVTTLQQLKNAELEAVARI